MNFIISLGLPQRVYSRIYLLEINSAFLDLRLALAGSPLWDEVRFNGREAQNGKQLSHNLRALNLKSAEGSALPGLVIGVPGLVIIPCGI